MLLNTWFLNNLPKRFIYNIILTISTYKYYFTLSVSRGTIKKVRNDKALEII